MCVEVTLIDRGLHVVYFRFHRSRSRADIGSIPGSRRIPISAEEAEIPDSLTVIGMLVIISSGVLVSQAGRIANVLARRRSAGIRGAAAGFALRKRQYSGF